MATANTTNFNVDPYYDDFDEDKNFHRILYRPGRAVQARELTQQQTILQNQINRFGYHIFEEGSEVSGAGIFLDNTVVARLNSTYGGSDINVNTFEGQYARGRTSERLYYVKKAVPATGGDNDLLHLQYIRLANTSSAVSNAATYFPTPSEVFDFSADATVSSGVFTGANTGAVQLTSAATANGLLFHVDEGIFYTNGFFVKNQRQSTVITSTSPNITVSVGFNVNTEFVTSTSDSTLLDPASGSYNYTAPGADRYKISLNLTSTNITDESVPNLTSKSYIELARIQNGNIIRKSRAPDYNILEDELARRTYDESGHYSVNGLDIRLNNRNANSSFLTVEVSPGKAYVRGYEVQNIVTQNIPLERARDTESVTEQNMTAFYGNYVFANTLSTALFDLVGDRVDLHANTVATPGDKVGEAYIKNIEYFSGTGDQRVYKVYLYDVKITNPTLTFDTTKIITSGTDASALIHSSGRNTLTKFGSVTSGANTIVLNNTTGITKGQLVENATHLPERAVVTDITFDTITLNQNAILSNTNASLTFSSTVLKDSEFNRSYFPLPNKNVTGVTNVDYKFKRKFPNVTFTSGSATIQTNGGTERFSSATGSLVNENFFILVKTGATGALANGENVDMTTGSRTVSIPTPTPGSPASATIDLDEAGFNGTVDVIAAIDVTGDSRKVKSYANNVTKTFDPITAGTKHSLGYSDVYEINAIYEGNSTAVTSNDTNVTNNFIFDNGQRDNYYDHATIQLKSGQSNTTGKILVDFDRFSHGGGLGYFVADSYPDYATIPTYRNQAGNEIYLRDVIDFRPIRSSNTNANVYSSTSKLFENHQIVDSQTFEVEMDYSYYLPRIDKLTVDEDGTFSLKKGTAKLKNPPEPADDRNKMTLATFKLNPYTYDNNDLDTTIYNNARYTMKDIGDLERRIERVEYYTSLNLLETQINNRLFTDDDNNVLFKNGFIVDPFIGHNVGDVFNNDYKVSIDPNNKVMRPQFTSDSIPFVYSSGASTLQKTGDYLTVPYSETSFINQNTATGFININPFSVQSFVGNLKLDPPSDIWQDFDTRPDIIVNQDNVIDNLVHLQSQAGTQWGEWREISKSVNTSGGTETTVTNLQRTGTISTVEVNYNLVSETTNVISSSYSYFMRSKKINFTVTGMRPNTKLFMFMDGNNITGYMGPSTLSANSVVDVKFRPDDLKSVVTDDNGSASGFFFIPNDANLVYQTANSSVQTAVAANLGVTFADIVAARASSTGLNIRSGTVPVFLTDSNLNTLASSTYAITTFTSKGRKDVTETTKVMEREYQLVTSTVEDEKTLTTKNVVSSGGGSVGVNNTSNEFFLDTPNPKLVADSNAWQKAIQAAGGYYAGEAAPPIVVDAATYTSYTDTLVDLYQSELGRAPDQEGYEYWAGRILAAGDNPDQLVAEFNSAVEEAKRQCAAGTGIDPLAQTFFISADFYPKGITITSLDLFFRTKDANLPVRVEIRPTVNGFPSSSVAIPLTQVAKNSSEVNVPAVGSNSLTATNFAFQAPVHLLPGEYAVVVLTDSLDYTTFISRIGERQLGSTDFVTTQPNLGVLFKSQNARTWTAAQEEDLCFRLYRADFTTGTNYTATLSANNLARYAYNPTSNTEGKFDVTNIVLAERSVDSAFNVTYELQTKTDGGTLDSFVGIVPNQDIFFDTAKIISSGADIKLKATYNTSNRYISPYMDATVAGASLIKNRINNTTDITTAETSAAGGDALARYITRKVTLAEGFSATTLKVFLSQNMPQGSSVEVYYKVLSEQDDTPFNERGYVQMTRLQSDVTVNEELNEYEEYEYFADGISYAESGTTFNTFNQFAIKVVLYSSSTARPPTIKNFRAIAFT